MIWNHKQYMKKPVLVRSAEDQLLTTHRRWYSQFYSKNSPTLSFKKEDLDWWGPAPLTSSRRPPLTPRPPVSLCCDRLMLMIYRCPRVRLLIHVSGTGQGQGRPAGIHIYSLTSGVTLLTLTPTTCLAQPIKQTYLHDGYYTYLEPTSRLDNYNMAHSYRQMNYFYIPPPPSLTLLSRDWPRSNMALDL